MSTMFPYPTRYQTHYIQCSSACGLYSAEMKGYLDIQFPVYLVDYICTIHTRAKL